CSTPPRRRRPAAATPATARAALAATTPPPAPAAAAAEDPERRALFENQPPLKQSEIPAVIEYLLRLDSEDAIEDQPTADRVLRSSAERHGMTPERLSFAVQKCTMGVNVLSAGGKLPDAAVVAQAGTALARPTSEELELIRPHQAAIAAAWLIGDEGTGGKR
ncbi:MAG: hypothetical protein LBQ12_15945, partial [Deltaproteobacteria bacterium]|nr:hypothetical protein [Deltaproteobacteria bacterium]